MEVRIHTHLMEGLMRQDPEGKPWAATAESWEAVSPTEYVFKIRESARWSDGVPVRAQDFEFAWRRAVDPTTASGYAWIMNPIKKALGMARMASGEPTSPKMDATTSTDVPERVARVAPHITSPTTMSSGPRGVNSTAS